MAPTAEECLLLAGRIREDQAIIERLFAELESARFDEVTSAEERIVIGYRLHNLYNAFENIFRNVARTFENHLDSESGWHAELLSRMKIDLRPLRPALLDAATFEMLDELRRFRHVFRSLYGVELDPVRMAVALGKARALREAWTEQIDSFLRFLADLSGV
jgi:hypothetical protein